MGEIQQGGLVGWSTIVISLHLLRTTAIPIADNTA
jgi:hypothetical protein